MDIQTDTVSYRARADRIPELVLCTSILASQGRSKLSADVPLTADLPAALDVLRQRRRCIKLKNLI
jgi:hypothetical protein